MAGNSMLDHVGAPGPLFKAEDPGVVYINDDLTRASARQSSLHVTTSLGPGEHGRGAEGWFVRGGIPDSYTKTTIIGDFVPGNRSLLMRADNGRAVCGFGCAPAIWEFMNFGSREPYFNPCGCEFLKLTKAAG